MNEVKMAAGVKAGRPAMHWVSVRDAHGRLHLETRWSVAATLDAAPPPAGPVIAPVLAPVIAVDATHAA